MADREDTPDLRPPGKRRPITAWGDTQRAEIGAAQRASLDSQRSRQRRSAVTAIPETVDEGDITSPIELLDAEPTDEDNEIVRRSRRDSDAPIKPADLAKVIRHFDKHIAKLKSEEKSNNGARADQLLELLNRPPDEATQKLSERVAALERGAKMLRVIVWLVIGSGSGSLLVIADRIWDRAEREGEAAVRLLHVEQSIDRLGQDIRDSHRYSPAAERPSWPQPSTKATPP